jgi:hypothetical protein
VSFLPFATDLVGDHKDLTLPCEIEERREAR